MDLFEYIAGRARHDRVEQGLVVGERGEHQASQLGHSRAEFAADAHTVTIGETYVEDRDVWAQRRNSYQGVVGGVGLADDDDVGLGLQQGCDPAAYDLVVIEEEDLDGGGHVRTVPIRPRSSIGGPRCSLNLQFRLCRNAGIVTPLGDD